MSTSDIGRIWSDEQRRLDVERELAFERAMAAFAIQAINLPGDAVPDAVRSVLAEVGRYCEVDRCGAFTMPGSAWREASVTWAVDGAGAPPPPMTAELMPWLHGQLLARRHVVFTSHADVPDPRDRTTFARADVVAGVYVPFHVAGRAAGAIGVFAATPREWRADLVQRLDSLGSVLAQMLERLEREGALRSASLAQRAPEVPAADDVGLRRDERDRPAASRIVGQSAAVQRVMQQIRQVAATDSTVLLLGETGTGKELFATQIHELSARRARPMVRVNCAAIPTTLIESELFGREKGAFTGALARQAGRFELAHLSTIFLDEIGELPAEVQVKLLRVLEERTVERLGSPRPITVDTRTIAATHRNLEQCVHEGAFREDLYYRLNVFPIYAPPLRERIEDIPLLVWRFVEEFAKAFGKRVDGIDGDSLLALQQYHWPGNIRELRNTVERAMIVSTSRRLVIALPPSSAAAPPRSTKLADVERDHIRKVLESTRWRIRGAGGAADRLALKPTTLETRMAKLGIRRPK